MSDYFDHDEEMANAQRFCHEQDTYARRLVLVLLLIGAGVIAWVWLA